MTQPKEATIEKAKNALGIQEEIDILDLYNRLYNTRNANHPDSYPEELKKEAEEKFKSYGSILKDLHLLINRERLSNIVKEMVPYQNQNEMVPYKNNQYEIVNEKNKILELETSIEELKLTNTKFKEDIELKERQINELKKTVEELHHKTTDVAQDELIELYKPKKGNKITIGITTFLLLIITINRLKF